MRRLARFVFAALAAGSLAACVGACALWARSYSAAGFVSHVEATAGGGTSVVRREASAAVSRGNFAYVHSSRTLRYRDAEAAASYLAVMGGRRDGHASQFRYGWFAPRPLVPVGHAVTNLGVARFVGPSGQSGSEWAVVVPAWFLSPALAVLPGLWVIAWRRHWAARRRAAAGVCAKCGYDLRATPGRCPECGTAAAGRAVD